MKIEIPTETSVEITEIVQVTVRGPIEVPRAWLAWLVEHPEIPDIPGGSGGPGWQTWNFPLDQRKLIIDGLIELGILEKTYD